MSPMIQLEFEPDDPASDSGFERGYLILSGSSGECRIGCMIVLSAVFLMDQLRDEWSIPSPQSTFEFAPIDGRGFIRFKKDRKSVTVSAHQGLIGRGELHEVLLEVARACRDLERFVERLPGNDAGRHDFELALADFEIFVKQHASP